MEFTAEDWWALIGPLPVRLTSAIDFVAHDKTRRLAGPHRLGEVTLRPGEGLLFEQRPNEPIDLAGTLEHESWPIIVEGTSPSTVHLEHDVVAAARVARSTTLLALEWDEPWAVRTSPKRSLQLPPRIPDFERPNDPWSRPLSPELIREGDATDPIVLPTWLAEAWTAMDEDEYAANAAHAWHEGLLMIASHPSFAAGAFVSAVDALGHTNWARQNRGVSPTAGAVSRVKALLETEIVGPNAKQLIDTIYELRSGTTHEARLHGFELSVGAFSAMTLTQWDGAGGNERISLEPVGTDPIHDFLSGVLSPLRRASRRLVTSALGG